MAATSTLVHLSTVAQWLRISRPLALRMAKQGELPVQRTSQGLCVDTGELSRWVDERLAEAAAGLANLEDETLE